MSRTTVWHWAPFREKTDGGPWMPPQRATAVESVVRLSACLSVARKCYCFPTRKERECCAQEVKVWQDERRDGGRTDMGSRHQD